MLILKNRRELKVDCKPYVNIWLEDKGREVVLHASSPGEYSYRVIAFNKETHRVQLFSGIPKCLGFEVDHQERLVLHHDR